MLIVHRNNTVSLNEFTLRNIDGISNTKGLKGAYRLTLEKRYFFIYHYAAQFSIEMKIEDNENKIFKVIKTYIQTGTRKSR